jgi:mRNA-degrading endonuclease RelE of RelBE toxin-antitoxin system
VTYRIQYAPQAEEARKAMPRQARARFEDTMASTLGKDPYGHGSVDRGGDKDRREATIGGVFVGHFVSRSVMVVTAVQIVSL